MWKSKPTNFIHLKLFRCLAYAHGKGDKLDKRVVKCILLGYPNGIKGYKLWCLEPGL